VAVRLLPSGRKRLRRDQMTGSFRLRGRRALRPAGPALGAHITGASKCISGRDPEGTKSPTAQATFRPIGQCIKTNTKSARARRGEKRANRGRNENLFSLAARRQMPSSYGGRPPPVRTFSRFSTDRGAAGAYVSCVRRSGRSPSSAVARILAVRSSDPPPPVLRHFLG
jgi:hypothetical protein